MLRLDFVALEPDPERWQIIRSGLKAIGRDGVAVSTPTALAAVLATCTVEEVLIGPHGTADEHAQALMFLRSRAAEGTRIRVVGDRGAPRRVAEYLRLGPRVRVIEPSEASMSTLDLRAA